MKVFNSVLKRNNTFQNQMIEAEAGQSRASIRISNSINNFPVNIARGLIRYSPISVP